MEKSTTLKSEHVVTSAYEELVKEYLEDSNCRPFDWIKGLDVTSAIYMKFINDDRVIKAFNKAKK